jgi:ribonuclease BN (tRNA processing enzyme)
MSKVQNEQKIDNGLLKSFRAYHGHGKVDALAFRLETPEGIFAYSGDTGDCEGLRNASQWADIFVCEASARIGDDNNSTTYGHLTPCQAGEVAKIGGVKKLILEHHTGLDSDEEILKEVKSSGFIGEIILGKDFQKFEIE